MKYRVLLALGLVAALAEPVTAQSITVTGRDLGGTVAPRVPVPELVKGSADLYCSFLEFSTTCMMTARIQGAGASGFTLYSQLGDGSRLDPREWRLVHWAPTNPDGTGELKFRLFGPGQLPPNQEVVFFAIYRDGTGPVCISDVVPFVLNPMPRAALDFNRDMTGAPLMAGTEIGEQWAGVGVHIGGLNNRFGHPDKAILYPSSSPGGLDPDLATPGYGAMNDRPYGKVLIIPVDDVDLDGDGCVDEPNDEPAGGVIVFAFNEPTELFEIVLIDIDVGETVALRGLYDNYLVQDILIEGIGDNGVQRIGFSAQEVTRLEVKLSGSGAVGQLSVHGDLGRTLVLARKERDSEPWVGP